MVEKVSDFKMPEKVVNRLLRDALPDNVLVSKDAKNAACRSASIFILQLSIAAAERAQMNDRRTLENQDIIKAVTELGLGEYAPQLVRFGARKYIEPQAKLNASSGIGITIVHFLLGNSSSIFNYVLNLALFSRGTEEFSQIHMFITSQ